VREDIKAYIDGELSPERMAEVRSALEQDPELMQEYLAMKDITQKLQSLIRQPQVKGVEQTMQKIAPRRRFRLIEGFAVAAVLVICGLVFAPMFMKAKEAAKSDVAMSKNEVMDKPDLDLGGKSGVPFPMDAESAAEMPAMKGNDERYMRGGAGDVSTRSQNGLDISMGAPTEEHYGASMGVSGQSPTRPAAKLAEAAPALADYDKAMAEIRMVIKDAAMTIKVKDVEDSISKSIQLAATYKGYVENSSVSQGTEKAPIAGNITIRLPQQNFEKAMLEIEKFGDVTDRSSSGNDVTGEVTDIEARINTLKAEEESLRTLLRGATKMGDILDIKDRISQVRQQIESYDSQRRVLTRLSALSTISLRFTTDKKELSKVKEEETEETWFEDTKIAALSILKGIGRFIAQVATFAFILVPVWVPLLLFLLWFRRRAFAPTVQG
jgi:hypothetical protein